MCESTWDYCMYCGEELDNTCCLACGAQQDWDSPERGAVDPFTGIEWEPLYDDSMDGDHETALRDAGWGTDEDYGYYGGDEEY